jgi:hypothetical protein
VGVALVREREPLAVAGGFGSDDRRLGLTQLGVRVEQVLDYRLFERGRFLLDSRDARAGLHFAIAAIGGQLARDECQQARLAAAVGADEADLPASLEGERSAAEQRLSAPREREIAKQNHANIR